MGEIDLSQYFRDVEEHLTRVNGGNLVRIVGTGFELVRGWAEAGLPLSVVCRGIDRKAERHSRGVSRRPLRIEFCDTDVREVYDDWRRAVGIPSAHAIGIDTVAADEPRKRPSLTKQMDRMVDRLARAAGRMDLPESFQQALGDVLGDVVALREAAKGARGEARDALAAQLEPIGQRLMASAREASGPEAVSSLEAQAADELAGFRDRLSGDAWRQAIDATVARLLRDRYGLPEIAGL